MAAEPVEPLRVQLLGTVSAWRGEEQLDLGSGRQRAVFAALAMRANRVVSREDLVASVWGDNAPSGASGSLYTYVSRLRRVLEPDRSRWSGGQTLVSAGSGYSLQLEDGRLDVVEFDRLRESGNELWNRRDLSAARAAMDAALALWQGEALAGIQGPSAALHRKRLAELRLAALERRAEIMLAAGDINGAVTELYRLASAHPLRESLRGLLMTALHRGGRDPEALEVYEETKQILIEQLGIEPGANLRRVYNEIVARPTAGTPPSRTPSLAKVAMPDVFVGRGGELSTLRNRLADVLHGAGASVWVEGESGIGKSALLSAALGDAADRGGQLLWAAGDEVGRRFPLGLITSCLGVEVRSADSRRAAVAEALRAGDSVEDPLLAAVESLVDLVDQLCADGPVVLVLDDLQWADDASLLVWHRLVRMTRQLPLLLVGSARPLPRRAELDQLRSVVSTWGGDLHLLEPLDEAGTAELAGRLIGAEPGPALLGLTDSAAGNPAFIREIVHALVRDKAITIADGVADVDDIDTEGLATAQPTLASVVTRRTGHLANLTKDALRWAALLGVEFDLGDLATVMTRPASELIRAIEEATAAGVLREAGQRFAFRHPLVRRALYEAMPEAVRVALHRQAAETLDEAGAPVSLVAAQLQGAGVPVDAWVTRWLVANTNAVARRSPTSAADLLECAIASPGLRDEARETLTARLTRLLFWLGRMPETQARAVLAMTGDPERSAEMRLVLAYLDYLRHDNARAVEALDQVIGDPDVPEHWRARHQALRAMVNRSGLNDPASTEPDALAQLAKAAVAKDSFAVAQWSQYLWVTASMLRKHSEALEHINSAIAAISGRAELADLLLSLLDNKMFTLQNLDRLDDAGQTLDAARHLVTRLNLPSGPHIAAAVHYFWLGRWDEALADLDSVMRDGPEITFYGLRQHGVIRLLHGTAALIAAHRDDSVRLERHLKMAAELPDPTPEAKDNTDFLLMAEALAAEQRGRPAEALRLLTPMLDQGYSRMMLRHQWLPKLVRLAIDLGEHDLAADALRVCEAEAEREVWPARAAAAAQWCRGLIEQDPGALLTVAKHFSVVGRKIEHGLAAEDAAILLAADRRLDEARDALHDAIIVFTELGAAWDVRRAESRLAPFGLRPVTVPAGPLSKVELRIARLVAAGWPNADIATQLSLSRSTVQMHVARILRKLGVDSRLAITNELIGPG
ncbi:BTAD domain-containing putative transcriptional regulator [Kibdelosporangium persicum]|uniref:Transcriptional regulatory protein, C terminal n=1 Tax=Kibdelosporangium persicum TaxID=2698649 RepID=A0ABX2EW68_9PSEU|nr:BTAD domain-containing putative transcriptional regulator [Kibdelosporangium persicum]NRN63281.1 Transcriptional regulatory protein, C terminal [Kibdelosporangium persicum]